MAGVRAPLILGSEGEPPDSKGLSRGGDEEMGVDDEPGVDTSLTVLEPFVAAIDGEDGGSGERVK